MSLEQSPYQMLIKGKKDKKLNDLIAGLTDFGYKTSKS
jgi:hypothetical protein